MDALPRRQLRALFLSDVHLGMRGGQSARLADFLRYHEADAIYLVGDIVDGWRLRKRWHWSPAHDAVIAELLAAAQRGVRVVYLPGNHDAFLRDYCGVHFAGIEVAESAYHVAADGRRYLVIHGDHFDRLLRVGHRVAGLGAALNALLRGASRLLSAARMRLGLPYWCLAQWAKGKVKRATDYVGAFERALADAAGACRVDGVICGHVHHAAIHERFGIRYINCGDWVESCTAVAERADGSFELLDWRPRPAPRTTRRRLFGMQAA